jgi:hypothetical protein
VGEQKMREFLGSGLSGAEETRAALAQPFPTAVRRMTIAGNGLATKVRFYVKADEKRIVYVTGAGDGVVPLFSAAGGYLANTHVNEYVEHAKLLNQEYTKTLLKTVLVDESAVQAGASGVKLQLFSDLKIDLEPQLVVQF